MIVVVNEWCCERGEVEVMVVRGLGWLIWRGGGRERARGGGLAQLGRPPVALPWFVGACGEGGACLDGTPPLLSVVNK